MTDSPESDQIPSPSPQSSPARPSSPPPKKPSKATTPGPPRINPLLSSPHLPSLHSFLPSSLHRPPLNNQQYAAYFIPMMSAFERFHLTVHDSIVDEAARKVLMHALSSASTALRPYNNECLLILHMTEDGRKLDKFYEFVDSAYRADYMRRLRDAMAESALGTKE